MYVIEKNKKVIIDCIKIVSLLFNIIFINIYIYIKVDVV